MNTNLIKFLFLLRNASLSKKKALILDYSFIRERMIKVLYSEGFVQSFTILTNEYSCISVILCFSFNKSHLKYLKLLSKPSCTKYMKVTDLCNIPDTKFIIFFSTDLGFLTALECKKLKVGGKLLFLC
jgi:ribosomal protein S8